MYNHNLGLANKTRKTYAKRKYPQTSRKFRTLRNPAYVQWIREINF
ncbi:hypothetical protein HMPREF9412_4332 [Paenibacillus sp. HGF5]|nr:hypothetical protein HMPREF9412_4332 [Paenibacillus sp. HGF5]